VQYNQHMFEDVRPFDWLMLVVEILVLLLIGYEVGITVWHKRAVRRRMAAAVLLMRRGEEIEAAVPRSANIDVAAVALWKESVDAWMTETNGEAALHASQSGETRTRGVA
jgi:hypothetical protein